MLRSAECFFPDSGAAWAASMVPSTVRTMEISGFLQTKHHHCLVETGLRKRVTSGQGRADTCPLEKDTFRRDGPAHSGWVPVSEWQVAVCRPIHGVLYLFFPFGEW